MTARQRGYRPETDPLDHAAHPLQSQCETDAADRDAARDAIVARATSMRDLGQLLTALGLDNPAEITAQLAQRHQQEIR
jgi:hypothetical protein